MIDSTMTQKTIFIKIPMNNEHDLVICTLPWWDLDVPHAAPAVLKGIAQSYDYKVRNLDFNTLLFDKICGRDEAKYESLRSYFLFGIEGNRDLLDSFYDLIIDTLRQENFRFLGISVFSVWTHKATLDLLERIKHLGYRVVVGGRGTSVKTSESCYDSSWTDLDKIKIFGQVLKERNLISSMIQGDGEEALIDLLSDKSIDQTTKHVAQVPKLLYPFSDFDDVDWAMYGRSLPDNIPQIPVVTSKGCVRKCDFCDEVAHMPRFISKDGKRVAEEILYLSKKYGINSFTFVDSLVNGNMKSLTAACEILAEHNSSCDPEQRITWSGNWICRPRGSIKPDTFALVTKAGLKHVTIGVEHASDHVLYSMDKKTNVDGLRYELAQLESHGVRLNMSWIVGHWSESFDDFMRFIDFTAEIGPYVARNIITSVNVSVFSVLDHTPASSNTGKNGIVTGDGNFTVTWYSKKNPTLSLKTRFARYLILLEISKQQGWPMRDTIRLLDLLKNRRSNYDQRWQHLYKKFTQTHDLSHCADTMAMLKSPNQIFRQLLRKKYPRTSMTLKVKSNWYNGGPRLEIKANSQTLFNQTLDPGEQSIDLVFDSDFQNENIIECTMKGKSRSDTLLNDDGSIAADKSIDFLSLIIDGVDIMSDSDYYYKHTQYHEEQALLSTAYPGLYRDQSSVKITYTAPFWNTYIGYRRSSDIDALDFEQIKHQVLELDI